jgi:predicted nucleic acid-binding protein
MATRTFFDTNVLVYLFDADSPDKQTRARDALRERLESEAALISTRFSRSSSSPSPESSRDRCRLTRLKPRCASSSSFP